jgi:8-oxo-dGTP pyrophosphatase MutT (NUDIX family)
MNLNNSKDPGESLENGAIRECLEEAGINIKLTGILNIRFRHYTEQARIRVIFLGEPIDEKQAPKSVPDFESAGASYVTIDELKKLRLRSNEPLTWFPYVENGGVVHSLDILTFD